MSLIQKRTIPSCRGKANLFSTIIYITTKSEEFTFDLVRVKTTTWPRIDIEKETESIIGLFYTRSLFFVCSIFVLYSHITF